MRHASARRARAGRPADMSDTFTVPQQIARVLLTVLAIAFASALFTVQMHATLSGRGADAAAGR